MFFLSDDEYESDHLQQDRYDSKYMYRKEIPSIEFHSEFNPSIQISISKGSFEKGQFLVKLLTNVKFNQCIISVPLGLSNEIYNYINKNYEQEIKYKNKESENELFPTVITAGKLERLDDKSEEKSLEIERQFERGSTKNGGSIDILIGSNFIDPVSLINNSEVDLIIFLEIFVGLNELIMGQFTLRKLVYNFFVNGEEFEDSDDDFVDSEYDIIITKSELKHFTFIYKEERTIVSSNPSFRQEYKFSILDKDDLVTHKESK